MTTATAELCGHRWPAAYGKHRCDEPANHCDRPADHRRPNDSIAHPALCRCRCGATTTRKDTGS